MKELKIKKIHPLFTALITTMDKYEEDLNIGGVITKQQGTLKENQKVIAVGDSVRGIKVGDLVNINPKRFEVRKHKEGSLKDGIITDNPVVGYSFDVVEMENTQYLMLQDRDINYIIEDYEEVEIKPKTELIMPESKLIL